MAAERGEEAERDPVQAFIDEVFDEMMRESATSNKAGVKYGKDPMAAALVEAAVESLARPASLGASEIERVLFAQALANALAEALAPSLADALAVEIMKVLKHHIASESGGKESAFTGEPRAQHGSGEGARRP
ncbi:hypothetical protein ACI2L4_02775 [Streptomyces sparsogenes]|uniref:hypothetical protein n=1 Tax=Streptomyces sparsogenes TaxID=67365 RepID=UPI0033FE0E02